MKDLTITTRVKDLASRPLRRIGKEGGSAGKSIAMGFVKAQLAMGAMRSALRGLTRLVRGFTTDAIKQGDAYAKMSRRLGIAVETLSAFAHVAELSGTSFQGLANGLKLMVKNAYDASTGTGEAKDAIADLRVEVTDSAGKLKDVETLFFDFADALGGMDNQAKRAAIATQIFGRSGLELIPIIERGRAGVQAMMEDARRLGLVWTATSAAMAEKAADALTRFHGAVTGIKNAIAIQLLPSITDFFNGVADYLAKNRELIAKKGAEILGAIADFIISSIGSLVEVIGDLKDVLESFRSFIRNPVGVGKLMRGNLKGYLADAFANSPLGMILKSKGQLAVEEMVGDTGKSTGEQWKAGFLEAVRDLKTKINRIISKVEVHKLPGVDVVAEEPGFFSRFVSGMEESVRKTQELRGKLGSMADFSRQLGAGVIDSATQGFQTFFQTIISGSASAGEAFRAFGLQIVQTLQRIAVQRFAEEIFSAFFPTAAAEGAKAGQAGAASVPHMAAGGIVSRPTLALVGESGPEAVVPLSRGGKGLLAGGGVVFNIYQAPGEDSERLAARILAKLRGSGGFRRGLRREVRGGLLG